MTFLLFLASLAVMEYLLRKPRKKPDDSRDATKQDSMPVAASMPGLLALGEALEAQGRGKAPTVEEVPKVHAPPVDGV
ncbi:MAG: hypothetical protein WCB12_12630 [Bryobacteraceae bacterium]